jgi:hypothetical protein
VSAIATVVSPKMVRLAHSASLLAGRAH